MATLEIVTENSQSYITHTAKAKLTAKERAVRELLRKDPVVVLYEEYRERDFGSWEYVFRFATADAEIAEQYGFEE